MKKHSIMAVAMITAMLMGAVSCSSDDGEAFVEPADAPVIEDNTPAKKAMTFKAGSEGADKSLQKTAYDGDLKMVWQAYDNFSIFPVGTTDNDRYDLTSGEGTNSCEMEGTSVEADGYFAMYPYSSDSYLEGGQIKNVLISPGQWVKTGQFYSYADILVAYSTMNDMSFQFRHIGSKLGVTVPIDGVKSIVITCSEVIAGFMDVSMDANPGAIPTVTRITDGYNTITLFCDDPEGFVKGKTYYACVIPTSNSSSLKLTFYTDDAQTQGMYFEGNIADMKRNMRNMAAPPVEKGKTIVPTYTLAELDWDSRVPWYASKIVFGYKKDYDVDALGLEWNATLGDIDFYVRDFTEFYILSDNEICLEGDCTDMFSGYESLSELDLSNFNTEKVDIMSFMFSGCFNLTTLDLSNLNTGNVFDMSYMFSGCTGLSTLDLSNFNTEKVLAMEGMFNQCTALTTLDLSGFDTKKVVSMSGMFYGCSSLENIYVGTGFNVDNLLNDNYMFSGCEKLPGFDPNVTDMTKAHTGAGGYLTLK